MAKLFSGMSKDSILDGLVEKTGKNGHELYDYLISLIEGNEPQKPKTSETTKTCAGKKEFAGSRNELIDLLRLHGADCYGISAVSPYGLCVYAARVFGVSEFLWYRPIQIKGAGGKTCYLVASEEAFLDESGNEIF